MDFNIQMAETAFGQNTRQNMRNTLTPMPYALGSNAQAIARTGYLARIHWHFNGTLTVVLGGGTAVLDALGPWNTFNRVRILANSGQDIYSTTGYGNYLIETGPTTGQNYDPTDTGLPAPLGYSPTVYAAPTAAGANVWNFGLTIPVALNESSELGLVLLQNEMAQTTLAFESNASVFSLIGSQAPVLVTGAATATLTGTIVPMVEYFAVPADPNARPDISWLHQVLEVNQPIAASGDNTVNLVRDNMYIDLIHHVILNNAPNTLGVDRYRLLLNQSETPYDFNLQQALQFQRRRFHRDLPVGMFTYPLFDQGKPGFGDERDLINGRATSELQSIVTINSGAVLGVNASRVSTITRQLVKLTTPPSRVA